MTDIFRGLTQGVKIFIMFFVLAALVLPFWVTMLVEEAAGWSGIIINRLGGKLFVSVPDKWDAWMTPVYGLFSLLWAALDALSIVFGYINERIDMAATRVEQWAAE